MYFIGWAQVSRCFVTVHTVIITHNDEILTHTLQLWCSLFTKEGFHKAALGDHSPGPFRYAYSKDIIHIAASSVKLLICDKISPKPLDILILLVLDLHVIEKQDTFSEYAKVLP